MAKKQKVHSLTGRIDDRLMRQAFHAVKRNRGAVGIDKVSIAMFEENLDDRVVQEVVRRLLQPIFEPMFHDFFVAAPAWLCQNFLQVQPSGSSNRLRPVPPFGFRPGRSCHQAIERVLSFHEDGDCVTLDADIAGFFDNIPHKLIVDAVAEEVADTGYRFVRYADDFVVVCRDRQQAQAALTLVESIMTELGLSLSPEKTKVRDIIRRCNNLDADVIMKLNRVIRGTANYFATNFSTCVKLYQKLDKWIRMRVRCMKFKRKLSTDNYRMKQGTFDKKLGLLRMLDFTATTMRKSLS